MLESPLLTDLLGYWNGAFQSTSTQESFEVLNPASGACLAQLPSLGSTETQAAIAATKPILDHPPSLDQRIEWLYAIEAALLNESKELARIITAENGKPVAEARAEVDYAASFYRDAARNVPSLAAERLPETIRNAHWEVHHRPAGVAGLITPWNFPIAMLAKKLAAAIAAGCPSVIKPAEKTPLTCIAFFGLLHRLQLPPGLCNLVFGNAASIGQILCTAPEVRVLSFTGSTQVGKLLAQQSASQVKRLSMELGGNAPFVVFADANLELAVEQLLINKFRCAGQTCVCTNRVYVEESVASEFSERVRQRVSTLRTGDGHDDGVNIGPMIDRQAFEKVRRLVDDAIRKGAKVLCGGIPAPHENRFFPPTVLSEVSAAMHCHREEIFGPVVTISTFKDPQEAISLANDTEYGLAAYVFRADIEQALEFAAKLQFGHVGINTASGPIAQAPFGGMKNSGMGREGGLEGIMEFIELQTMPIAISST